MCAAVSDLEEGTTFTNTTETTPVSDIPVEPYLTLEEIMKAHPESKIQMGNVENSLGLSSKEAADRLVVYGKNILTPPAKMPEWKRLLKQFQSTFLLLLMASAALSLVAFLLVGDTINLYLAIVLLLVVFLTGFIQFHEEGKAIKVIDSFSDMLATECTVLRGGKQQSVDVGDLVPGDLVLVKNGEKVPADMVLLLCRGLKQELSSLTGESKPITCSDQPSPAMTDIFECKNLAFNSALCYDGMAIGLVIRTGDKTAIGTIAKLANETESKPSTLEIEVQSFVRLIAIVAVIMAAVCFAVSVYLQGANTVNAVIELFVNGFLIIIVANVPQGLPSTVISLLSLAARNMALKSVLVKRLDCVETLGCTSIICSDKTGTYAHALLLFCFIHNRFWSVSLTTIHNTSFSFQSLGTLTKNEMTVTDVWCNERLVKRHRWEAKSMFGSEPQAVLYRAAILCNRGEPVASKDQVAALESIREVQRSRISNVSRLSWASSVQRSVLEMEAPSAQKFTGNPSDIALLAYCDRMQSVERIRGDFPILFEVPFNSTNKWQLVVVKSVGRDRPDVNNDGNVVYEVLMKGAPEVLLGRCSTYASAKGSSGEVDMTDAFREEFQKKYELFASQGRRVLALCSRTFSAPADIEFSGDGDDNEFNFPTSELNFVGLMAIMDPPRDNVPEAIKKCHRAGVRVFMVTGDHPSTAKAIADEIGLMKSLNPIKLLENETSQGDWSGCDGAVIHGSRIDALTDDQWRKILAMHGVCFARTTPLHKLMIVKKCQELMGYVVAVTGDGVNDAPALKQADVGVAMGLNGSAVAQDSADIFLMDDNFPSIVDAIEEGRIIFDNIKKTIAYTMAHILPEVVSSILGLLAGLPAGLTAMQVLTIDLGTEMGPAISLAYEKPESDIMDRNPRDLKKDRLVSAPLLLYSYITSGAVITAGCLIAYWLSYRENDIMLSDFHTADLNAKGGDFFSLTAKDSVEAQRTGDVFTAKEQKQIFTEGVSAFYVTLTVAQFCHIWVCKTRVNSIFVHGFSNRLTFYGVAVGLMLVVFFTYVPGVQSFVGSAAVGWVPWAVALATGALLWSYNELSKWYFRQAKASKALARIFSW